MIDPGFTGLFKDNLTHLRACDKIIPPFHDMIDANGLLQRVYEHMSRNDFSARLDDARKAIALWATPHYGSNLNLFLQNGIHKYLEGWAHDRHMDFGGDQFKSWLRALDDLAVHIYHRTGRDVVALDRLPV